MSDTKRSTSTMELLLATVEKRDISRVCWRVYRNEHQADPYSPSVTLGSWDDSRMESGYLDQGIAGSITMITLTLATVILLRSFYKRYKRMEQRRIEDETK